MQYLVQGHEKPEYIDKLIKLTKIRSEAAIASLHDHYVKGYYPALAYTINSYPQANFDRTVNTVNAMAAKVSKYLETGDIDVVIDICSFTSETVITAVKEYYRTGVKPDGVDNLNRAIKRVNEVREVILL